MCISPKPSSTYWNTWPVRPTRLMAPSGRAKVSRNPCSRLTGAASCLNWATSRGELLLTMHRLAAIIASMASGAEALPACWKLRPIGPTSAIGSHSFTAAATCATAIATDSTKPCWKAIGGNCPVSPTRDIWAVTWTMTPTPATDRMWSRTLMNATGR